MKPEVEELLDKARRSIKTAQKIFKDGEVDFAGSRAYYALFYIAEALLLERGLAFSSHSAVIANFGKEFARTQTLNPKFHNYLIKAQDRRNIGDYAIGSHLTEDEVREMLDWAKEFLKAAKIFLTHTI
ncbi:MAG TPA: HEPN domain-containing protein [Anaerolineales bacterium]|nr:HEPN domain-containing protein [Anaerolineales bacterium]HNQ95474.1 HEPN domain-containing protein [Anaerolineales bacterium]HNS62434.1 HEPN domain-containing protein [Anaerolineales bacterium]